MTKTTDPLLQAAVNAAAALKGVYELLDRVNAAGGCYCISGVAAANAMVKSLNNNRERFDALIVVPLQAAIDARSEPHEVG